MRTPIIVASALLDAAGGDPHALPHPVRAIGVVISHLEQTARHSRHSSPAQDRRRGIALTISVVALSAGAAALTLRACGRRRGPVRIAVESVLAASTIAWGSLIDEVRAVEEALNRNDLTTARSRVARIVGRDTHALDASEVARAAIETLAESCCDGIVAPLCSLAAGGVPAAFAYKAINTLDSMVGHREPPYRYLGWFAAKLDDAANIVPARLTALLIAVAAQLLEGSGAQALEVALSDAWSHASPNAGWPEAAMAGALGVRLGGTNSYDGAAVEGAVLGAHLRTAQVQDVRRAMRIVTLASVLAVILAAWYAKR